jgi:signal peptidase I
LTDNTSIPKRKSTIREYAEAIFIALLLALFIRTFVVQAFKIPSGSMEDTLLVGDHILVNKFIYGIKNPLNSSTWIPVKQPQRKDIIVFRYPVNPSQDYIKRVIGVPGDTVEVKDKNVYINGNPLGESYAIFRDPKILPGGTQKRDNMGPVTVPENSLFVMGDNRDNSYDSRFWEFVKIKEVKGKAFILYWSWDKKNFLAAKNNETGTSYFNSVRWNRIGDLIH